MNRSLRGALALACALLLPAFAWAATLSATPANVWPEVLAAQPGDVVQLQPGAYVLDLWNLPKAAPGVTVMPAQAGTVTASEINTSNSPNLIIKGMEVLASAGTQYAVTCSDPCQGQVFDGLKVHQADNKSLSGVGLSCATPRA
jgi:nitrous oxidase accessory protein NosD